MKFFVVLRKIFSFLSLISLLISIPLLFYIGFRISQTQSSGILDLRGVAYLGPIFLIGLSVIFLILTIIFNFLGKDKKWSFGKFFFRWLILFIVSLISFGLSILIAKS